MRSWTATYDSRDQRHDVLYFRVTIYEGAHHVGQLMVEVFMFPAGDGWGTAEFVPTPIADIRINAADPGALPGGDGQRWRLLCFGSCRRS